MEQISTLMSDSFGSIPNFAIYYSCDPRPFPYPFPAYPFQGSVSSSLRMVIMESTSQSCGIKGANIC